MPRLLRTGIAVGLGCVLATAAAAQDAQRGVGVADRERPEYDPVGIRAGGFIIYPATTASVEFTDNLFNAPTNEEDDTVFAISPELLVETQWSRHALNFEAGLTSNFHSNNDSDDVTEYNVGVD
ncbi:MAG: outer membrane beta-barrel protein, partial [Candidatus Phaeomarinobacter sp.]